MIEISERLYYEHLGVAGALAISVFVMIGLLWRLHETDTPRMHVWAMIGFFAVNICDNINSLAYSDVFNGPNVLFGWTHVLIPGFLVALHFYIRALTTAKPRVTPADAVHLIPFALGALCLSPILSLPADIRRAPPEGAISDDYVLVAQLGETAFWALWILWLIVYGVLGLRRLAKHQKNVRAVFSDIDGKTLRWLDWLMVVIFVLTGFVVVDEVRDMFGAPILRDGVWALLFDTVLPLSFGIFALRANPVLPEWTGTVLRQTADTPPPAPPSPCDETPSQRYARSGLRSDDIERYAARLEQRMEDGQLWRDHGLNLRSLAQAISVPPIHLSEVLNTKLGMTFYDYVNQCRVRDACDLLIQTDDSIIEISETVGFNAKSTFNTSFKKVTEQTPSQWRKRHRP